VQLQDTLAQFSASGIAVIAISPDRVETLAEFAAEHAITYPLLSDEHSRVIREFGILNTLLREDEEEYGIPYPGSYLVGRDGRVSDKFFHREYQVRETAATTLRTGFGLGPGGLPAMLATHPASGVTVQVRLGATSLAFMQLADLYVSFELPAGIHVYGRPIPDGYRAVGVRVMAGDGVRIGDPVHPPTRPMRIAGLAEEFNVYEERAVIRVPIVLGTRPSESFTELAIEVEVTYQACTDEMCFAPVTEVLSVVVPLTT